jgi:hypothetical protein
MIMPNSYLHDKAGIEQCGDPINAAPLASRCVRARGHLGFHNNGNGAAWGQPRCDFRFTSALRCTLPDAHAGSHHTDAVKQAPRTGQQLAEELFYPASNWWASMGTAEASLSAEQPAEPGVWRPGRQQPRNFYEGDRYVGVAFDPVDTRRVIDAMNAPTISSELRDKADTIAVQQAERFRQLGKALDVDISGQTWDDLIRRVQLQRTDARDKVADYRERNSTLARMYEQSSGEREDAESEVARLKAENESLRPEVKRLADSRDEVRTQLTKLQVNSQCPSLLPTGATDAQLMIYERKCVRVNGHAGAHIRTNGSAW